MCAAAGCDKPALSRGYCDKHYRRFIKHGSPEGGKQNHGTAEERFWRYVDKLGEDECWPWKGGRLPNGYGQFSEGGRAGKKLTAHRYSCILHHGPPQRDGAHAMHECDNPPCVNPAHLRWGSASDNVQDAYDKGRREWAGVRGEAAKNALLTEEKVRFIRSNASAGAAKLARMMGIKRATVYAALSGATWKHVK